MAGLVAVLSRVPGADGICDLLRKHGFRAERRSNPGDCLRGDPAAILLSPEKWDDPVHESAERLRAAGYKGIVMVLGLTSPDLPSRRILAENEAWYLPANAGPEDVASRLRMLL